MNRRLLRAGLLACSLLPLGVADAGFDLQGGSVADPVSLPAASVEMRATVADFYAQRDGRLAWFDEAGPRPAIATLASALRDTAWLHGLEPDHYLTGEVVQKLERVSAAPDALTTAQMVRADLVFTDAWLLLVSHLHSGRFDPHTLFPRWTPEARRQTIIDALAAALDEGELTRRLQAMAPNHDDYRNLKRHLWHLRELARETAREAPNDERLAARIGRVRINMERLRRLPDARGEMHVMVNVPAFRLQLVEDGAVRLEKRVIVGRTGEPTPAFSANMLQIAVNPVWDLPHRIAVEEKLPVIRRDPGFLERERIAVLQGWGAEEREVDPEEVDWESLDRRHFPYRLRQAPGGTNPLGRLQFLFPNPRAIYIHDTPARHLFEYERRTFSAGCIRLEDADELARRLLTNEQWTEAMKQLEQESPETRFELSQRVPVHIVYLTVEAEDNGTPKYWADVYGRDGDLLEALLEPPARTYRTPTTTLSGTSFTGARGIHRCLVPRVARTSG